jgi:hypothetical protein
MAEVPAFKGMNQQETMRVRQGKKRHGPVRNDEGSKGKSAMTLPFVSSWVADSLLGRIFHGKFLAFDSHLSSLFRPANSSIRAF